MAMAKLKFKICTLVPWCQNIKMGLMLIWQKINLYVCLGWNGTEDLNMLWNICPWRLKILDYVHFSHEQCIWKSNIYLYVFQCCNVAMQCPFLILQNWSHTCFNINMKMSKLKSPMLIKILISFIQNSKLLTISYTCTFCDSMWLHDDCYYETRI